MKVFAFKIIIAALIVAGSDGSGGRLSPYSPSDKVTTKLVKQFWAASNKNRPGFLEPHPSGATNTVVLAWIKSGETSQPIQTLAGTDSSGKKRQVSIAVLSHLRLVSIESDRRTLLAEVELFPDITPDDLIKKQPTYRQLWADYRKTIQLRIEAIDSRGRTLALIDSKNPSNQGLAIVDLPRDTTMVVLPHKAMMIDRTSLWWAIPSVMDDPQYPYRFATGAE